MPNSEVNQEIRLVRPQKTTDRVHKGSRNKTKMVTQMYASTKGLNVRWLDCHVDVMGRLQSIRVHLSWRNNLERNSFKE